MSKNDEMVPKTITAKQGDLLIINFLFKEPHFISIEELGFAEMIRPGDSTTLTLNKKGEFPIICEDCKEKEKGMLIVE